MSNSADTWVPKVHPLTRTVEPEDPLELVATPAPGDPDVMLECVIQEFAWMGWSAEQLLALFRSPEYPVLNQLLAYYGEDAVRGRVHDVLGGIGGIRFRETIDDEPGPEDDDGEPELISLSTERIVSRPV